MKVYKHQFVPGEVYVAVKGTRNERWISDNVFMVIGIESSELFVRVLVTSPNGIQRLPTFYLEADIVQKRFEKITK